MSIALRATALLLLSLFLLAASSEAATYIVPRDAELVARADAIVVATAKSSRAIAAAGGGIRTVFELQVTDVVKGPFAPGAAVAITEEGGALAGRFELVVGSPRYVEGQEYLVFLEANAAGEYRTWGLGLGQFAFEIDASGQRYLTRSAGICGFDANYEPHIEWDRKAAEFIGYVRAVSRGAAPPEGDYRYRSVRLSMRNDEVQSNAFSRNSYLMQAPGFGGFRWESPQFGYSVANATPAEEAVAQGAASAWAGAGGSGISVSVTPATDDSLPGANSQDSDGKNVMRFGDVPSGGGGAGTRLRWRPPPGRRRAVRQHQRD